MRLAQHGGDETLAEFAPRPATTSIDGPGHDVVVVDLLDGVPHRVPPAPPRRHRQHGADRLLDRTSARCRRAACAASCTSTNSTPSGTSSEPPSHRVSPPRSTANSSRHITDHDHVLESGGTEALVRHGPTADRRPDRFRAWGRRNGRPLPAATRTAQRSAVALMATKGTEEESRVQSRNRGSRLWTQDSGLKTLGSRLRPPPTPRPWEGPAPAS